MSKFKFSYDGDNDDLLLFNPNSTSKGSVELGSLILDYNTKKEFVGLQIMDASKFIKDVLSEKLDSGTVKKLLASLKECKVFTKTKNGMLILRICLVSSMREIEPINVSVPSIRESSPALAAI